MFENNRGLYVASLHLTQGSSLQRMLVSYNVFRGNVIEGGANPSLNERTWSDAVVILSSSNVNLTRNNLENVQSKYELSTHLLDLSVTIQVV